MAEQNTISGWYLPESALPDFSYTPGENDPIGRFTEEQQQLYGYQPQYLTAEDLAQLYNYETQSGQLRSQLESLNPADYGYTAGSSGRRSLPNLSDPAWQQYMSARNDLSSQISGLESSIDDYYTRAYSRAFGEDYVPYSGPLAIGGTEEYRNYEPLKNLNALKNEYATYKAYKDFVEKGAFPGVGSTTETPWAIADTEAIQEAFPDYDLSNINDRLRFLADDPLSGIYFGEQDKWFEPNTSYSPYGISLAANYPGYAGYDWQQMVEVDGTPYTNALIGYAEDGYRPEVLWGKRYDPPDTDWYDYAGQLFTALASAVNPVVGAFATGGYTAAQGGDLQDIVQAATGAGIGSLAGAAAGDWLSNYLGSTQLPQFLTDTLSGAANQGIRQALRSGNLSNDDLTNILQGSLKSQLFGLGKEYMQNYTSGKGTTMNIFGQADEDRYGGFSIPQGGRTGGFNPQAQNMPNLNDMVLNDAMTRGELIGGTADQLYGAYAQHQMAKEAQKTRRQMAQERDRAARMADPMMDERAFYQNQLRQLYENPDMITQMPGYDFRYQQGLRGLERQLAKGGYLGSGNRALEVMNYGQNLASTEYQNEINRLYDIISGSFGGAQQAANIYAGYSPQLANLRLAEQQSRLRRNQAGLTGARGLYDIYQAYFGNNDERR